MRRVPRLLGAVLLAVALAGPFPVQARTPD